MVDATARRPAPGGGLLRSVVAAAAGLLLALTLLAACGGGDETTTSGSTTAPATSSAAAAGGTTTAAALPAGPAITQLQTIMTTLGYFTGPVDGVYGPETTDAVKKMQTALGVTADGLYGPETHAALGDAGKPFVAEVQQELAHYGYYTGAIDGAYGDATKAAVEKLQQDLGVTVDGRIGPETVNALREAVASGQIKPV
jgi:peptidoglycan endopeptidase LytF